MRKSFVLVWLVEFKMFCVRVRTELLLCGLIFILLCSCLVLTYFIIIMEIFAKVIAVGNVISVNRNRNGISESVNKREVVLKTLSPMTSRCDFYVSTALHLSHLSHVCLMFVSQMRQVQSVEGMRVRRG